MADAERRADRAYGEWRRLAGASLAPYHLGRLTTYTVLGAVAGTATALFAATRTFAWLSAALLVVAAALMVLQAVGLAAAARSPLAPVLTRLAGPLIVFAWSRRPLRAGRRPGIPALRPAVWRPRGGGRHRLDGKGALAMAAFAVGTVPALIAVGWGGLDPPPAPA